MKCYTKTWFTATDSLRAPLNDIEFLMRLDLYKNDDKIITYIAINKFINHLWYLNEECSVFTLFDDRINIEKNGLSILVEDNNFKAMFCPICIAFGSGLSNFSNSGGCTNLKSMYSAIERYEKSTTYECS